MRAGNLVRSIFLIATAVVVSAGAATAAPPTVSSLSPAGVRQGTTAEITLNGKLGDVPLQVDLPAGLAAEWIEGATASKGPHLKVTAAADAEPGLTWLRVYNADGAAQRLPLWIGTLSEVAESEPNQELDSANEIALPAVVNGVLSKSGEVDTFRLELSAGSTFIASLESHRAFASPMDGVLQLVSEQGFVVAQNDDHRGNDPQLEFPIDKAGIYFLRVFAFPATPNSTIAFAGGTDYVYRVTVTQGPFVDHVSPVQAAAEEPTRFTPRGWNLSAEEALSRGDVLALPGTHAMLIDRFSAANVLTSGATIEPGGRYLAWLAEPGGTIAAQWEGRKGVSYRFQGIARAIGSPVNPVLRIKDDSGKLLKEFDDISRNDPDVNAVWRAPADATYTCEVADRFEFGGLRDIVLLELDEELPDYQLSVKEDHFTVPKGKSVEIEVTVTRAASYAGEISISAEELPEGVTAEAVVSPAKGDASKAVKLKLSASEEAQGQGPIRIVGRATEEGGETRERTAEAPAVGGLPAATDLWLTVGP